MEEHVTTRPGTWIVCLLICLVLLLPQTFPLVYAQDATPPQSDGDQAIEGQVSGPIVDGLSPVISQPLDVTVPAYDASGASVIFTLPTANDETDGQVNTKCDWESGAVFPLGSTLVTCTASDLAGNESTVTFYVHVADQTPPQIMIPTDLYLAAADPSGAIGVLGLPVATDNVDSAIVVSCDWASGSLFPVGTTIVNCWGSDAAGNAAAPIAFRVVVDPPPTPVPTPTTVVQPTVIPTETQAVQPTAEPTQEVNPPGTVVVTEEAAGTPSPSPTTTEVPSPTLEATATAEASPTEQVIATAASTVTPTPDATPTSTPVPTPTSTPLPTETPAEPVPAMLDLPWPPPGHFTINSYGGPLNGIDAIWGYQEFPISQEFGHTEFSILHFGWYAYGMAYGLDGYEHPGLDIGMPAGTWLYSPVDGTVKISGGTPHYTYYGNGDPYVGQLLIVTDDGHEVVLGHMGRIAVDVGDRVAVGDFVGLSGGDNGDHLHLEVREIQQFGWYRAVDPRTSFLVEVLKAAAEPAVEPTVVDQPPPPVDLPPWFAS